MQIKISDPKTALIAWFTTRIYGRHFELSIFKQENVFFAWTREWTRTGRSYATYAIWPARVAYQEAHWIYINCIVKTLQETLMARGTQRAWNNRWNNIFVRNIPRTQPPATLQNKRYGAYSVRATLCKFYAIARARASSAWLESRSTRYYTTAKIRIRSHLPDCDLRLRYRLFHRRLVQKNALARCGNAPD